MQIISLKPFNDTVNMNAEKEQKSFSFNRGKNRLLIPGNLGHILGRNKIYEYITEFSVLFS